MTTLPDERMVEAADAEILTWADTAAPERVGSGRAVLSAAFAALDREALIEAAALGVADAGHWPHGTPRPTERERVFAERALRAVGLIR